jgi:hypothetical protein
VGLEGIGASRAWMRNSEDSSSAIFSPPSTRPTTSRTASSAFGATWPGGAPPCAGCASAHAAASSTWRRAPPISPSWPPAPSRISRSTASTSPSPCWRSAAQGRAPRPGRQDSARAGRCPRPAIPRRRLRRLRHRLRNAQHPRHGPGPPRDVPSHAPGGQVMVLEMSAALVHPFRVPYLFYLERILPALGKLVAGDDAAYIYLSESILRHPGPEAFAGIMSSAGLVRVEVLRLTWGAAYLHIGRVAGAGRGVLSAARESTSSRSSEKWRPWSGSWARWPRGWPPRTEPAPARPRRASSSRYRGIPSPSRASG